MHGPHPRARRGHDRRRAARCRRCSSWAPASTPSCPGRENMYLNGSILGLSKPRSTGEFDEIVEFAGLERFIDTPVKNYSSGMYVRLGFSVAINVDPDILLVDEVLAVGDEEFQRRCNERFADLRAAGQDDRGRVPRAGVDAGRSATRWPGSTTACSAASAPAGDVVDEYLAEVHQDRGQRGRTPPAPVGIGGGRLERLELLDADGRATDDVRTGEAVTFRLPLRRRRADRAARVRAGGPHPRGHARHRARTPATPGSCPTASRAGDRRPRRRPAAAAARHLRPVGRRHRRASLHVFDLRHRALRFDVEPGDPTRPSAASSPCAAGGSRADVSSPCSTAAVVALPGELVAIVLHGPGDPGPLSPPSAARQSPAYVRGRRAGPAPRRRQRGRPATADYLVFVPVGASWPGSTRRCIAAPARRSLGRARRRLGHRAPAGALELFVPLGVAVVRHSAFHAVGGFDPASPSSPTSTSGGGCGSPATGCAAGAGPPAAPLRRRRRRARRATGMVLARVLDDTSLDAGLVRTDGHGRPPGGRRRRLLIQRSPAARRRRAAAARPRRRGRVGRRRALRRARGRGPRQLGRARAGRAPPPHRGGHLRHAGAPHGRARASAPCRSPGGSPTSTRWCSPPRAAASSRSTGFEVRQVGREGPARPRAVVRRLRVPGLGAGRARLPRGPDKVIVADVYDPMHLEQLEQGHDAEGERGRYDAVRNASARAQRAARTGRLHALRQREAARPLARPAGRPRPDQPGRPTTATSRCAPCWPSCPSASATSRPVRTPVGDPRRHARHRPRRQGGPLGRRGLQLVRPAHARPRRRPAAPADARRAPLLPRACATRTPTSPRCAWRVETQRLADELGLVGHPRVLQPATGWPSTTARTSCSTPTSA